MTAADLEAMLRDRNQVITVQAAVDLMVAHRTLRDSRWLMYLLLGAVHSAGYDRGYAVAERDAEALRADEPRETVEVDE